RSLRAAAITTWVSTPSFAGLCLAERRFDGSMLPGVRRFLFCGEVLPPDLAEELLERFPEAMVWNAYGPTEATVATAGTRTGRDLVVRYSPLPVGRPIAGTRVLVVDAGGHPVKPGERGEIVIAGPNVGLGYVGMPELAAKAFFELDGMRAYRTGDAGHY